MLRHADPLGRDAALRAGSSDKTGALTLAAEDERGERIDARFELWIDDERVYMEDVLRDEEARAMLPVGAYRLRVTRGVRCAPLEREVCVTGGGCTAMHRETFDIPENAAWIVARVRMKDTGWDETRCSFTTHMCAGYDAFTNPIFLAAKIVKNPVFRLTARGKAAIITQVKQKSPLLTRRHSQPWLPEI